MRRTLAAIALAATLTACGGTGDERQPDESFNVEALQIKLRVLKADPCYSEPDGGAPAGCEKYVTQVGNTANTAAEGARSGHHRLAAPAQRLSDGVDDYRDRRCRSSKPSSEQECFDALTEIALALDEVERALDND